MTYMGKEGVEYELIQEEDECSSGNYCFDNHNSVSEYESKLKCGEIILSQDEWKILFRCDECGKEISALHNFLMHLLEHHFAINSEVIRDLVKQTSIDKIFDFNQKSIEDGINESNNDIPQNNTLTVEEEEDSQSLQSNEGQSYKKREKTFDELCIEVLQEEKSMNISETNSTIRDNKNTEIIDDEATSDEDNEGDKSEIPMKTPTIFSCDICEKRFKWRERYELHMRRHNGIKPFACEFCNATFADTSNYNTHRKRHLGIKPHVCDICSKAFTATTDLRRHRRSHTGERPYKCPECDRSFKTTALLNVHRRRHSNNRPYICTTCGKGFYEGYHLRDHEVSHRDERPFPCLQCDAKFSRHKALVQHTKLHSAIKEYGCQMCGKQFAQKSGLISHLKTHR